jgi:hypothetical protein
MGPASAGMRTLTTIGRRFIHARVLCDAEKAAVWGKILAEIPQIRVYETRTDRNVRVFRLERAEG